MTERYLVLVEPQPPNASVPRRVPPRFGVRVRWQPIGLVAERELAETIVGLQRETSPQIRAMAVAVTMLSAEVGAEEAERILDRVHNRTTAETARAAALEQLARERLASAAETAAPRTAERRAGVDRRSGQERRASGASANGHAPRPIERRSGRDRRSGSDRRRAATRATTTV